MNRNFPLLPASALILLLLPIAEAAANRGPSFKSGHFYMPTDEGWIVEWDPLLNEVSRVRVADVETATGATFNDRGNLVFLARRFDSVHVLEVDAGGNILAEFDTRGGSLLRGSYIDFDPVRHRYVFADDSRLTYLDAELTFLRSTDELFERASGVVFDRNGNTYATDQFQNSILKFDRDGLLVEEISFPGFVAVGLDIAADARLLVGLFGDGQLEQLELASRERSTLISGLGWGGISDVEILPDGRLLTINASGSLSLYTGNGELILRNTGTRNTGDSAVLFIPEPASALLVFVALACGCVPARRGRIRERRARRAAPSDHPFMASGRLDSSDTPTAGR